MERIAGRILPVCIIFVFATSLSSCDFLRKMAGRPTSAELVVLEQKRDSMEIERRLKRKRQGVETPSMAQPAVSSSVPQPAELRSDAAEIQALKDASGSLYLRSLSRFKGGAQASELFYVIAGTFKEGDNAERYARRLQTDFPQAQTLTLGNGYTLTAVYATGRADHALAFLAENKDRLPSEAWVLINDLR